MSSKQLIIEGAKQNNLKNISLTLPHNRVIAVTGISGSGKSSLAFDTIFAEGQWRFIESLSTYARLFIEKLDRPDVDAIRNIRPAIALEQHNPIRGSRSTVGTITELYDLFRILYARIATRYCPVCGHEIVHWSSSSVIEDLVRNHSGERAAILFLSHLTPAELIRNGFFRVFIDGEIRDIKEVPPEIKEYPVVVDRLVIEESKRLSDSVETAWKSGGGAIRLFVPPSGPLNYSEGNTCDHCGYVAHETTPILFSFNHPLGACPVCKGFGNILKYDPDIVIPDQDLSLAEGAIEPWEKPAARWWKKQLLKNAGKAGLDTRTPFRSLPDDQKEMVSKGTEHFYGITDFFDELESRRYKLHVRVFLSRYRSGVTCPECAGKRLKKEALSFRIAGKDIADLSDMKISELMTFFDNLSLTEHQQSIAHDALEQISLKLRYLRRVGLDYLSLSRPSKTLSGGEYQRINLSNQLASHLTGTLYVLDEPTVGLHARDTETISAIMHKLAELGNTIIVVEHDRDIIARADWIVELGPGGGKNGGNILFSGAREAFPDQDTLTARYLRGDLKMRKNLHRGKNGRHLVIDGCTGHNLKNAKLTVPLGTLTVVTGVSGSGKSSLVVDTLYQAVARRLKKSSDIPLPYKQLRGLEHLSDIKLIDQSPLGRSPRSNPATYLKVFDPIRKLFADTPEARAKGYSPGFFSFNVPGGRCEDCTGEGYQKIEMFFFEDVFVTCPSCNGSRYTAEALRVTYRSKTIRDILEMTIDEAFDFFSEQPRVRETLSLLRDIGLGYLRLGQPATTFSGGEAQRLKICEEIAKKTKGATLYILDEPTVGLHMHDVSKLVDIIRLLVQRGDTVVVIEHNLDFVRTSDWIIDLGPEGGDRGGEIVFEGILEEIRKSDVSITGKYLRSY
ncbi:MAG: excinuclease ABC subunit UvrA [bacterium]